MSMIQISTLYKINTLIAKITLLTTQISDREQLVIELEARKEEELVSYAAKMEESEIQKQSLENFAKSQKVIHSQETQCKNKIAHKIESLISVFFEGNQFNDLILKIIQAHPDQKYVILADPILAKKLNLKDAASASAGVLHIIFDHKKFDLSPEYLAQNLREKLLIASFN